MCLLEEVCLFMTRRGYCYYVRKLGCIYTETLTSINNWIKMTYLLKYETVLQIVVLCCVTESWTTHHLVQAKERTTVYDAQRASTKW